MRRKTRGNWGELQSPPSFVLFCFCFSPSIQPASKLSYLGKRSEPRENAPAPRGFAARSRVLARLASLAQIGELARRLSSILRPLSKTCDAWNRLRHSNPTVYSSNGLDDVWVSCNAGQVISCCFASPTKSHNGPIMALVVALFSVSSGRAPLRDKTTKGCIGDLALVLTDQQANESDKNTVQYVLYTCTIEPPSATTSLDTKIFPESFIIEILVNGPRFQNFSLFLTSSKRPSDTMVRCLIFVLTPCTLLLRV